jgi:hypothetical protein
VTLVQLQKSGLSFSKSANGKLKIAGDKKLISRLKTDIVRLKLEILQWLETTAKLEPSQEAEIPEKVLELPETKENAPRAAIETLTDNEITRILERAVNLEFELQKSGKNKELRATVQNFISKANNAEHSGDTMGFNKAVSELKTFI